VLRDLDLQQDFEQITRGLDFEDRRHRLRLRRRGWNLAAVGVALQIGGLIVGTFGRDGGQAGGSTAGATHAGHIFLLAGLGVAAIGALIALIGPALYENDRPATAGRQVLRLVLPFAAVALVAAGVAAVQGTVLRDGGGGRGTSVTTSAAPGAGAVTGLTTTNSDVAAASVIPDQALDPATRAKLAAQLTLAREVALKYPTVADALKAHMYLAGGFAPGAGAHYMWMDGVAKGILPDGEINPLYPASFIYDGTSPTSRIAGLMYISLLANPPDGFAGPNDHWHRHFNLCVQYGPGGITTPFPADADITRAQCTAIPGAMFMQRTVWMLHTWVVPGYESPDGVFSHANPDLRCLDGTYDTNPQGFCQGT
jgi:hypothetical protein